MRNSRRLTALTANEAKYQPGFENIDTVVSGAITLYGVYGRRSAPGIGPRSDTLPARHLHGSAPPFLVVHGDADSVLSVDGARDFADGPATECLRIRSSMPNCQAPSTHSTCSDPCVPHTFSTRSSASPTTSFGSNPLPQFTTTEEA